MPPLPFDAKSSVPLKLSNVRVATSLPSVTVSTRLPFETASAKVAVVKANPLRSTTSEGTRVRRGTAKSGDLTRETRGVAKHKFAVDRHTHAVIERDAYIRCSGEVQDAAGDDGVAAAHGIVDQQRGAVGRFEQAGIDDGIAGVDGQDAAGRIGLDRAVRLVDQCQVAIAGADLTGARNGVIDIRQRGARG